jgi:hypothetical protein
MVVSLRPSNLVLILLLCRPPSWALLSIGPVGGVPMDICERQRNDSPEIPWPYPQTCANATLPSERDFADVIKVVDLEHLLDYPGGVTLLT